MADPSTSPPLTRASVQAAHELIKPYIHRTPVLTNTTLNKLASAPRSDLEGTRWAGRDPASPRLRLWFKCENFQKIGAFKARGAFHAVERLKREDGWEEGGGRERGVVTHSSGEFCVLFFFFFIWFFPCLVEVVWEMKGVEEVMVVMVVMVSEGWEEREVLGMQKRVTCECMLRGRGGGCLPSAVRC